MRLLIALMLLSGCSHSRVREYTNQASSVVPLMGLFGGGTGFVVRAPSGKSYILTNAHVCQVALMVEADRRFPMEIIEVDANSDLCLVEARGISPALEVATEEPDAHDNVHIIGYGMLLGNTLSEGHYVGRIQGPILRVESPAYVTAVVLPGNSGSPVLNDEGKVVGVVYASSPAIANRALIVPIEDIKEFLKVY